MRVTLSMPSQDHTARLAEQIGAGGLVPGDCLLLDGPVGAGKTHFARHLIWSLMQDREDVPSPTFTLVQTYDTPAAELWHADLYRLHHVQEIEELGLVEAMETAICLIEWPQLLGPLTPKSALSLRFQPCITDENTDENTGENTRTITLEASESRWTPLLKQLSHDW